jgi:hypothetical protein
MIPGMQRSRCVEIHLDAAAVTSSEATARKLLHTVEEFHISSEDNRGFIPNHGERDR